MTTTPRHRAPASGPSRRHAVTGALAGLGALALAPSASAATFSSIVGPRSKPSGTHPYDPILSAGWDRNPFSGLTLNAAEKAVIATCEKIQRAMPEWSTNAARGSTVHRTTLTSGYGSQGIPVLTHAHPTWYSAGVSTVASKTDLVGHYVSLDWFKITAGPHSGQYICTGALHRSDVVLPMIGALPTSQLAPVPAFLRNYPTGDAAAFLNPQALKQLIWMNAAWRRQFGSNFALNEGYRSAARQDAIYDNLGSAVAAAPGTSNHEYGLAVDIDHVTKGGTPGSAWMNVYSPAFGFQRPAVFDRTTTEFWHYNYVG